MIIHQIIITSMLVFAIHYTMLEGEVFGFIRKWWKRKEDNILERANWLDNRSSYLLENGEDLYDDALGKKYAEERDNLLKRQALLEKISQPIFDCPVCMAPWHGTYLYWLIPWPQLGLPSHDVWQWAIIVISALGLNSIIVRVFKNDD